MKTNIVITRQNLPSFVRKPTSASPSTAAEHRMAEARATNPLIDQFRKGGVPKELRLMAAQGALPLKPEDLARALDRPHQRPRRRGPGRGRRRRSSASPPPSSCPILKSRETPAAVLAWAVRHRPERELREVALQNTTPPRRGDRVAGRRRSPRSWPSSWSSTRPACSGARACSRRSRRTPTSTTTSAAACASCARRSRSARSTRRSRRLRRPRRPRARARRPRLEEVALGRADMTEDEAIVALPLRRGAARRRRRSARSRSSTG